MNRVYTVGVLSIQGSFREHMSHLDLLFQDLNEETTRFLSKKVGKLEDLDKLDGLIIPGGESTTMTILLQRTQMFDRLQYMIQVEKLPVWGTCAGLILLSNHVSNTKTQLGDLSFKPLGGLDVQVERNSFGRQLDSFKKVYRLSGFDGELRDADYECVFIRAPTICKHIENTVNAVKANTLAINDAPVEVLLDIGDKVVAVRQGNVLGTSFHPELNSGDYRMHKWFVDQFIVNR